MRKKKNDPKLTIYDNNVKLVSVASQEDIRPALRAFGYEAAAKCEIDFAVPEGETYIALKVNPIKGIREVHHIFIVKE